jgi:hypothetical protein
MKRATTKPRLEQQSPGYMRLIDLAQLLDVTHAHLCNLVRRGALPAIRIGTVYRVPMAVAKKVMAEGCPSVQRPGRRPKTESEQAVIVKAQSSR